MTVYGLVDPRTKLIRYIGMTTDGGEGAFGSKHSDATKAKLRLIKLNQSEETRAKIGEANRTRVWSASSRAKASASQKGRKRSLAIRLNMSRAIKIATNTPEERAARSLRAYATASAKGYKPCGTPAAYKRGCRCESCVRANRAYGRIQDAKRAPRKQRTV